MGAGGGSCVTSYLQCGGRLGTHTGCAIGDTTPGRATGFPTDRRNTDVGPSGSGLSTAPTAFSRLARRPVARPFPGRATRCANPTEVGEVRFHCRCQFRVHSRHRSVRPNSYPHWHNTGNVLM